MRVGVDQGRQEGQPGEDDAEDGEDEVEYQVEEHDEDDGLRGDELECVLIELVAEDRPGVSGAPRKETV